MHRGTPVWLVHGATSSTSPCAMARSDCVRGTLLMPLISFPHCRTRVRCSHPLALRYVKQPLLKLPPFVRSLQFAHEPGLNMSPVYRSNPGQTLCRTYRIPF